MSERRYRRRTWADRDRPRVLDVAPGLVHESGPRRGRDWAPERVAVMAHWSVDPEPSRSVVTMLGELAAGGYETVLVSAAEVAGPIGRACSWAPGEPEMERGTTVLRRANVGYDFGSWAAALEAFPGIRQAPRVLLVNDSLIGPFSTLAPILADFEACETPVWGLSGSLQHRPHVQSFFVGYRDGVLDSPPMRGFWTDIRVEARKSKIVRYDELGLSEALDEAGIEWRTMFEPRPGGPPNPTMEDAGALLVSGLPLVKANARGAPGADPGMQLAGWQPPFSRAQDGESAVPAGPARGRERLSFKLAIEGVSGLVPRRAGARRCKPHEVSRDTLLSGNQPTPPAGVPPR